MDSWIFKNVSQILTQKPSPQTLISPLFPSITSIKLSNHYVDKKKQHQIKSKHINKEKLKPNNKEKITSFKAKKLHDIIHEMKKTNRYLKKNIYSLSLHEQHIINSPTGNKNKSNNIEKNKINIFEKNLKYNRNNNNHKSNFNSNPKSKQKNITDIFRLSKNLQQNETTTVYDKETMQFQPLSNRVEILYTILPDHIEQLESNNSIK
ncbi:GATA zinc finger domain-containing protein 15-like [Apis dorsata]|uniref:GATA zinc finger domain-containing protein 15-like n=1 Tax=Apis dorsata TaxID=7462 RepID=UPI0003DF741E|nr:GATA zinc finger domain-containing protein 15-like [Apis dorsata]